MTRHPRPTRRAFSLVEVTVVVIVLAVLAAVVVPGFGSMQTHQTDAAADVLRGLLRSARAHAGASGRPTGVEIQTETGRALLVAIDDAGDVGPAMGVLGQPREPVWLTDRIGAAGIESITLFDGSEPADGAIWFGFEGNPESRDDRGVRTGDASDDASVQLVGGRLLVIDAVTGFVR